jgi:hypothetical protein
MTWVRSRAMISSICAGVCFGFELDQQLFRREIEAFAQRGTENIDGERAAEGEQARRDQMLARLGRPVDLHALGADDTDRAFERAVGSDGDRLPSDQAVVHPEGDFGDDREARGHVGHQGERLPAAQRAEALGARLDDELEINGAGGARVGAGGSQGRLRDGAGDAPLCRAADEQEHAQADGQQRQTHHRASSL